MHRYTNTRNRKKTTCEKDGKEFVCLCLSGFLGKTCEHFVGQCEINICENVGICYKLPDLIL